MSTHNPRNWKTAVLALALFVCASPTRAQQASTASNPPQPAAPAAADPPQNAIQDTSNTGTAQSPTEKILTNFVESGGNYEALSNNFGSWNGGYVRSAVTTGNHTWNAEINGQHEFGDAGVYMDGGDTYTINPDWYASLNLGTSVRGFFWPRIRVDSFLNRKWAARKQFITTIGVGYDAAKDVHRDHTAYFGTNYYFQGPWIIEDGVHFNVSNPGQEFAASGFVAVTEGRNKQHYLTVNVGFGHEAYQLIGPTTVLTRFPSETVTVTWRQWMGRNWGFNLVSDYYNSPFYHRGGSSLGFFREF